MQLTIVTCCLPLLLAGWDRGVEGMRVGDKRRLTIPPQMAYGSSGVRGAIVSCCHHSRCRYCCCHCVSGCTAAWCGVGQQCTSAVGSLSRTKGH